jgi:hypothetical protein
MTKGSHLLEALREIRLAVAQHTDPSWGYTADRRRDEAIEKAAHHIKAARETPGA